jgi:hypothetical protein
MLLLETSQLTAVASIPLGQVGNGALLKRDLLFQQRLLLLELRLCCMELSFGVPHLLLVSAKLGLGFVDVAAAELLVLTIGDFEPLVDSIVLGLD